jgi:hypothetical protein
MLHYGVGNGAVVQSLSAETLVTKKGKFVIKFIF